MALATAPERVKVPAPARLPGFTPQPRRAVEAPGRRGPRWSLGKTAAVGGAIVLVSLLMVVAAGAYMTQGQVRLTRMQGQLTSVLGQHRNLEERMAQLSNPSTVVSQSQSQGLVPPYNVTDLPQVNVSKPSTTTATTSAAGHGAAGATGGP
jgi:hypothetical protein